MSYVGQIRVNYGPKPSRLERFRFLEEHHARLLATVTESDRLWSASSKSADELRDACTCVAAAVTEFTRSVGVPVYGTERLTDLLVALGELHCGRHSVLLSPAPVHPGKYSASDLQQQAMAQVCVDLLRDAGLGATEARAKVSGLFEKHQLPKFGEAKLRALNSRLKGPGASQDEAYDMYLWAQAHAQSTFEQLAIEPTKSVGRALKVASILISLCKRRDHRRHFFFAPGEDSSPAP